MCDLKILNEVVNKWRNLGEKALDPDQINKLYTIAVNHPRDVVSCCKCVFETLNLPTDATWNKLIQTLKDVKLNRLASQLEHTLIAECKLQYCLTVAV